MRSDGSVTPTDATLDRESRSLIPAKPVDYVLNTTYLYELPSTGQDGGVVIYEILGMSIFIIGVFVFLWKKDLISRKYFAYRERKQKKNNK